MAGMHSIDQQALKKLAVQIFVAAGTPEDIADHVCEHLLQANRAGHDSHGMMRVPEYVRWIEEGRMNPSAQPEVVEESATTVLVDGARGFGQYNASFLTDLVLKKAKENNVAAGALRNGGHIGRLGHYSEVAARQGMYLQVISGSYTRGRGQVTPYGGMKGKLGTNPWSLGFPVGEHIPLVVDFATSTIAEGKVRVARDKHVELPPGSILNSEGKPSKNPQDFYDGGVLLPFGQHKGSALSIVAALLGAAMSGTMGEHGGGGVFMIAVNPDAFGGNRQFEQITADGVKTIKDTPTVEGVDEILVPGEPEERARAQKDREGISLPDDSWKQIVQLAEKYKLDVPPTRKD